MSKLLDSFNYAVSIACGQIGLEAMIQDSPRDISFAAENLIRAKSKWESGFRANYGLYRTGI